MNVKSKVALLLVGLVMVIVSALTVVAQDN
jgi:hypothetical protein